MKLLFFNPTQVRFTVATPEQAPLGGSESCAAWLARHLAARGHDVTLMAELPPGTPARLEGVRHLPPEAGTSGFFRDQDFEAIITLTSPHNAENLKRAAPRSLQIAWLHLLASQPDMQLLPQAAPFVDCAVMVSNYQRAALGFAGPSQVIGNGIAPAFENMFASAAQLRAAKQNRAVYTSIPDRGLDWLAEAFPLAGVETRLDVYSGMRIYQRPDGALMSLYDRINAMPHCRRHDAIGQRELAAAIRSAAFLTYPGNVPETYCIVALEAIAAGLKVIAIATGALPETTLGFADLMPMQGVHAEQVPGLFAAQIRKNVGEFLARPEAWAEERFAQSQEVSRRCAWSTRAKEWEEFLGPAIAWKRGV